MAIVGFLINPIAGMGGSVGLKGTDGLESEARARGAEPQSNHRSEEFSRLLSSRSPTEIRWLTCGDPMGESELRRFFDDVTVVHRPGHDTGKVDTQAAVRAMVERGCDLIVFCGGDGTARDIFEAVGNAVPLFGIPGGVKMYSGLFAITPGAAAILVDMFARGEAAVGEAEVADIDEGAYRKDIVSSRVFGIAKTLFEPVLVPSSKEAVVGPDEDVYKEDIARTVVEMMDGDTHYVLGAGSTTARIAEELDITPTLLGIDVVKDGKAIALDVDEATLLSLAGKGHPMKIVLSPLGAKGTILGRGTGPLTARVIECVGMENIVVVATPLKLAALDRLLVDTGNKELDAQFSKKGYLSVINGYRNSTIKKIGVQNV